MQGATDVTGASVHAVWLWDATARSFSRAWLDTAGALLAWPFGAALSAQKRDAVRRYSNGVSSPIPHNGMQEE